MKRGMTHDMSAHNPRGRHHVGWIIAGAVTLWLALVALVNHGSR